MTTFNALVQHFQFDLVYLYSAVIVNDGSNFSLILPDLDTEHMNVFLFERVKECPYNNCVDHEWIKIE
ncbi:hypothetical protein HE1_00219 [Holospora elegans E1]|uniref:Uncharacterized protein n=1 Tax=Holospora elegans E1 TaxID=1427503 RepID=A0A023DYP1_9PROT|nr:hypothetical protein [Holospora elegans]GAJ45902.1 hypothetical protein HE1_00219 [Holospora elegans E1]